MTRCETRSLPWRRVVGTELAVAWATWASLGCAPLEDVVFEPVGVEHGGEPVVLREDAGMVSVPVRLTRAPAEAVSARFTLTEIDAQSSCQAPDFYGASGRVEWPAGSAEARVPVVVVDDDAAELDEAFALELDDFVGLPLSAGELHLVIEDDDRSGIVDARSAHGFAPGGAGDQSAALQAALDAARSLGRGVVHVTPGDYEVAGVTMAAGTTLSGRGARFHRPVGTRNGEHEIAIAYAGAANSARALIEGLALDGRRDQQGAYDEDELADSHLIALGSAADSAARLRAALEGLTLGQGTGSGVFVGPQVDARLCRVHTTDLWRDAVTLRGGGTTLDIRQLDASATLGTTGLWFDGQPPGFRGTHRIDVNIEDTELGSGDLEIEAYDGSRVELTRFRMARGPLRLQAPDGSVRIVDSHLETGAPSAVQDFFGLPHDMTLLRTALVVSGVDENGAELSEDPAGLVVADVRWQLATNDELPPLLPAAPPPHALVFDQCTFERGADVPAATRVYAVRSAPAGGTVTLTDPTLGAGVEAFAPECDGCTREP
jgi:hypothetical protein